MLLAQRPRNESSVPPAFVWGTVKVSQLFNKDISCLSRDPNSRSPEQ